MNKSVKQWMDNKELFMKELAKGHKWELAVAKRLLEGGYNVKMGESAPYEMPNDPKYANSHDLTANGHIVEVKSRNLDFSNAEDFPYPTIFVKSKHSYDKMDDKPTMCVVVSQKSGNMLALDVEATRDEWTSVRFYDRVRKIHTTAYECRKELWEEFEECAKRLLSEKDCR